MKKHKCDEPTGLGNVKSTRIEDIEYDMANLKNDTQLIRGLYNQIEQLQKRMSDYESQTITQALKKRIRRWLQS